MLTWTVGELDAYMRYPREIFSRIVVDGCVHCQATQKVRVRVDDVQGAQRQVTEIRIYLAERIVWSDERKITDGRR